MVNSGKPSHCPQVCTETKRDRDSALTGCFRQSYPVLGPVISLLLEKDFVAGSMIRVVEYNVDLPNPAPCKRYD